MPLASLLAFIQHRSQRLLSDARALGVAGVGQRVGLGDCQGLAADGGVVQSVQCVARGLSLGEAHDAVALIAAQVYLRACMHRGQLQLL